MCDDVLETVTPVKTGNAVVWVADVTAGTFRDSRLQFGIGCVERVGVAWLGISGAWGTGSSSRHKTIANGVYLFPAS